MTQEGLVGYSDIDDSPDGGHGISVCFIFSDKNGTIIDYETDGSENWQIIFGQDFSNDNLRLNFANKE